MERFTLGILVVLLLYQNLSFCVSLNSEGLALLKFRERVEDDPFGALASWVDNDLDKDPCGWFGVECSDGKVVTLKLRDLCLKGTLAPELGKLTYIKSIVLRNNFLYGKIPNEIGELKELEVLDLGYNNFTGFPSNFGHNLSLSTLLLDNNDHLESISLELFKLKVLSEFQTDERDFVDIGLRASCGSGSIVWNTAQPGDVIRGRQLQMEVASNSHERADKSNGMNSEASPFPSPSQSPESSLSYSSLPPSLYSPSLSPSDQPSPSPSSIFSPSSPPSEAPTPSTAESPSIFLSPLMPPPVAPTPGAMDQLGPKPLADVAPSPALTLRKSSESKHRLVLVLAGTIGGFLFIVFVAVGLLCYGRRVVVSVKPWATGLSGQLQKAFVSGVPQLNRSELEAACEDFSNIIGFLPGGTMYKGTLSSGIEIAVLSSGVKHPKDWSKELEAKFRNKIDTLSKVNHKNFVNLIGYCDEESPFTRMMVFEYVPNGTLYEHLHVQEAEHLDWAMRLRIAMGMTYCLEHMHNLTPPVPHTNLASLYVYLTEDYAAKISDFSFWNDLGAAETRKTATVPLAIPSAADLESNIYNFGLILLEMVTGKEVYTKEHGSLAEWTQHYLKGNVPLTQIVDPTLESFPENEVEKLHKVIKSCTRPDPKWRPTMKDVTIWLREITSMSPEGATPKLSPLWWAELEIISEEAS